MSIDFTVKVEIPQLIITKIGFENPEFKDKLANAVAKSIYSDLYHGNTITAEFEDYDKAILCELALNQMIEYFNEKVNTDPMPNEEYVFLDGSKCPNCHSDHFNTFEFKSDGGDVWQKCDCMDCNATWQDNYKLTGYSNLKLDN
jgi:hypothetical protein